MATINDIGVPGQPLDSPPLTDWQAAVRDALTPALTNLTPASGWVDYGSTYGGMYATQQRRIVVAEGMVKPTADKPVTAGTSYQILSGAPIPQRNLILPCIYTLSATGAIPVFGRITVDTNGLISLVPPTAGTITAANGYVSFAVTYRSAT